jgi:hypothetical protein
MQLRNDITACSSIYIDIIFWFYKYVISYWYLVFKGRNGILCTCHKSTPHFFYVRSLNIYVKLINVNTLAAGADAHQPITASQSMRQLSLRHGIIIIKQGWILAPTASSLTCLYPIQAKDVSQARFLLLYIFFLARGIFPL